MVEKYGWDQTPTPDLGLDITKAPSDIQKLYKWVIEKTYGEDVASAYAQGLVAAGIIAQNAEAMSLFTSGRMDELDQFVKDALIEMTDKDIISAPELIGIRKSAPTAGERIQRDFEVYGYSAWWWGVKADGETDDTIALQAAIDGLQDKDADLNIDGDIKLTSPITLRNGVRLHFKGELILPLDNWNDSPTNFVISVPNNSKVGIFGLSVDGSSWGDSVINAPLILNVGKDCDVDIRGLRFENFDLDLRNQRYDFMTYKDGLKGTIRDIFMKNVRALGNGIITDDPGAIRLAKFEYTGVPNPSDFVMEGIRAINFGNRSEDGDAIEEDSDLIYFFSSGEENSVLFKDIKIFNSGKRAIKVHFTNGVRIEDIEFYNHGEYTMTYAISVLGSTDVHMKNIRFNGKIQRGLEIRNSNNVTVDGVSGRAVELDNYFSIQFSLLWINDSQDVKVKNVTGDWHCVIRLYGNTERVVFEDFLCTAHILSMNVYTNPGDVVKFLKFNNVNISKKKGEYSIPNKPSVHFNNNNGIMEDVSFENSYLELTAEYSYGGFLFNKVNNIYVNGLTLKPVENLFNRVMTFWGCTGLLVALQGRDPYDEDLYAEIKNGGKLEFVNCSIGKGFELGGANTYVILTRTDSAVTHSGGSYGANITTYNSTIK